MDEREKLIYTILVQDSTIKLHENSKKLYDAHINQLTTQLNTCIETHNEYTTNAGLIFFSFSLVLSIVFGLTQMDRIVHVFKKLFNHDR